MFKQKGEVDSIVLAIVFIIALIIPLLFFGLPVWHVWKSEKSGQALFAQSESGRRVLVSQAEAERDAAKLRAEAIAIVGKAAKEFPEYRQQEFIGAFSDAMKECHPTIIYVPTEAGIPIVDAGRGLK
jgi:hypothetical protein